MAFSTKMNPQGLSKGMRPCVQKMGASRPVVKANSARVDRHSKSDIMVAPSILSGGEESLMCMSTRTEKFKGCKPETPLPSPCTQLTLPTWVPK